MKKIDELFLEQESVSRKIIVASSILWIGMFIFYRLSQVEFDVNSAIDNSLKDLKFVGETAFVIMTNILAAMIFTLYYRRKDTNRVGVLKGISHPSFMKEVLKDVAHYRGIYCGDHDVYVKLRKHSSRNDILLCDLTYEYKKSTIGRSVNFTIYRITEGTDQQNLPLISDECLKNEFVWYNDETDFSIPVEGKDYLVSSLLIGETTHNLKRTTSNSGEVVLFSCLLDYDPPPMTFITYKVTIPVEIESAITITAEFPSNRGGVTFDYSDVSSEIVVSAFSRTGIKSNPVDLSTDNGIKKFRHNGWLLPKDGHVFSWWKLEKD